MPSRQPIPGDTAYRLQVDMAGLEREELRVALLTTKNRVTAVHRIYQGNVFERPTRQ